MVICPKCNEVFGENYVFCLNCGYLLKDYKSSNVDMSNENEVTLMVNRFANATNDFQTIMDEFSRGIDESSERMTRTNDDFSLGTITYDRHVANLIDIFHKLSIIFEKAIHDLQNPMFEMLLTRYNLNALLKELKEDESYDRMVQSWEGMIDSAKRNSEIFTSLTLPQANMDFEENKGKFLSLQSQYILFFESGVRELKFIKNDCTNNMYMSTEDDHNHFCIYCGASLDPNQHFCSQCGKEVYREPEPPKVHVPSKYEDEVNKIEQEYNFKQGKAKELVVKLFDPSHMSYQKFMAAINKSNGLFDNQMAVARKMIELDDGENSVVEKELENKIVTLNTFIDKMEDLINELVIQLSSNKDDDEDINALFNDMDDLIDSVKDY